MGPHDALFKWAFSIADHVAAELRSVLPTDILDRFDLTELSDVSETFLDPELHETRSDVLYRAPFTGHPARLYFLLEHQSDQDHYMPLRVYDYVRSIWKKWLDQNPKPKTLPLVFPVVFHHGRSPWNAPAASTR